MKTTLLLCLTFCCLYFVSGQPAWELQKANNGVKVYTADDPNSSVKQIKVEIQFSQSIEKVAEEIMNVGQYKEWIYGCIESTLISRPNDSTLIYRHVTDAPWPFDDRDQVSQFHKSRNPGTGTISITSRLLEDYPKDPHCVRIEKSNASWLLFPLKNGTRAVYTLSFDPGGNIPAWLINLFVSEGPYQTFMNLKKRLET